MPTAQIEAGTLTASRKDRIVSGLLLPFGEVGRTNLGKFSIDPGAIEVPEDLSGVGFNLEHERTDVIGQMLTARETPAGIYASFSVARTPAGDAALDEIESGTRKSLSAEVAGIVLRAGRAVGGRLFGGALVKSGAFPSATLLAADVGEEPDPDEVLDDVEDQVDTLPLDEQVAVAEQLLDDLINPETDDESEEKEKDVPSTLTASAPADQRRPARRDGIKSAADLYARAAAAHGSMGATMLAALDQMIQADVSPAQQPQWLGEIWGSRTFERRYIPLVQHADLTGLKATGWRFVDGKTPTVGDYTGFPAQPTSTEVKTEAVTIDAKRIAGGGEFDRAFIDFSVPGFWEGYYREASNDYARKSDAKVPAALVAGATSVEAGAVPSGVAKALAYIVDGAISIIDAEIGLPSYAIVGTDLWRELALTRADDATAYLSLALGLEDGTLETFRIVPSSLPALAGKVLVGVKDAYTFYELPGSPVRVDTVNIANGGGQTGLFGYWSDLVNQAKGLALVAPSVGP